jgi:hypothetical protein
MGGAGSERQMRGTTRLNSCRSTCRCRAHYGLAYAHSEPSSVLCIHSQNKIHLNSWSSSSLRQEFAWLQQPPMLLSSRRRARAVTRISCS